MKISALRHRSMRHLNTGALHQALGQLRRNIPRLAGALRFGNDPAVRPESAWWIGNCRPGSPRSYPWSPLYAAVVRRINPPFSTPWWEAGSPRRPFPCPLPAPGFKSVGCSFSHRRGTHTSCCTSFSKIYANTVPKNFASRPRSGI